MKSPSKLAIYSGSLQRLMKEEASYHEELERQEKRLQKLTNEDSNDENKEWMIKQQQTVVEETRSMFPVVMKNVENALQKLENQVEEDQSHEHDLEEMNKAKDLIQRAKIFLAA
ncbi:tubulin-specific chaperone Rbl2 [Erysiphe neolycopersici]|uniref:Tubulin-specific chaperone A n=1 Tax=Erysiphe neolycopersici TaxID=212602 RepID=A0A420HT94_9PEZI|nr:tubulin-specific chaperone Rbl2 [Erysiphe neolycopersici]